MIEKKHCGIITLVFLHDDEIKNLNTQYRNKNTSTDVLSFHYFEDFSQLENNVTAGEIILSQNSVLQQGKEYGFGTEKECYKLIIHSVFHILGYDHETEKDFAVMREKEKLIWNMIF